MNCFRNAKFLLFVLEYQVFGDKYSNIFEYWPINNDNF
jgi:hypothetical protein